MAAGLGFKTFTTGEVLTAADVNGYLMQGILVFATEAARNSAITSPQEGQFAFTKDNNSLWYYTGSAWVASGATGDIEGVTAGVGISGGGTSGTVTITNDMATTITASGDIVVGTGSGTYDNLPIGSTGQILTADTTVSPYKVKWATPAAGGGYTLINTGGTTLSGASVSITSIPDTYRILYVEVLNYRPANDGASLRFQLNSQTGAVYIRGGGGAFGDTNLSFALGSDNGTSNSFAYTYIYGYSTSNWKVALGQGVTNNSTTPANAEYGTTIGVTNITAAISSIQLFADGSNFTSGTAYVYGVK